MASERLQKILAQAGVASRRAAEDIILAGRVAVDGQVVRQLGTTADPAEQKITLDGKPLPAAEKKQYWLLNKPTGVVSTVDDPQGRPTVRGLLPSEADARLYPVGRLDFNSEGLMLLTNDGELAQRLMHPRHQVAKRYLVWVEGRPGQRALEALRKGVEISGQKTAPAKVGIKSATKSGSKLSITIIEGKKREIRRMCAAVGHPVKRLVRMSMGPLHLGDLPQRSSRPLKAAEVDQLRKAVGLKTPCKAPVDGVKKSPRSGGTPSGRAHKGR
ncbi:MAG: rRNA pseudouridine synthase [Desulfarculaceae bacterium]|nr:rRNA pseudouridine synthase [Desulfarculaceae bacterium]MCF8073308.1 rRNA pseudouridine synthase [Desulfarculaceae bacterium]MCF8100904.1 rRNA pseudouridine synthase [Desulfarculaceae bacterium]MCF8116640.1 rRNA pseudouridine synthase [Desulfarculaceae bacterium]